MLSFTAKAAILSGTCRTHFTVARLGVTSVNCDFGELLIALFILFARHGMPIERHLRRSPIAEATLDVYVEAASDLTLDRLRTAAKTLETDFPVQVERRRFEAQLGFGPDGAHQSATALQADGYVCWSADKLNAVQFRVDGFTMNRLHPYPGWSRWFGEFERLWNTYLSVGTAMRVTRLGVRCINIVPVDPNVSVEYYLTGPPVVPPNLDAAVRSFIHRTELATPDGSNINLVSLLQSGAAGVQSVQLVVDVEVVKAVQFDPRDIAKHFDELHQLRNQTFFSALTEDAIRSFE